MSEEQFRNSGAKAKVEALATLNKERNALMSEIDQLVPGAAEIVRDKL